jgi:hypothetical protein
MAAALREVVAPFVLTRALLVAVALFAAAALPYQTKYCGECDPSSLPLLNVLTRWDAVAYLWIARDGYSAGSADVLPTTAYSPLLPALMRGIAGLAGRADTDALLAAGALVSNAALLAGLAALVALARLEVGAPAARRAALYVLLFPTTFFLSAVYAESLLLALAAGSLLAAKRGRWWLAGGLAALGALARPFGILLIVPLVIERWRAHRGGQRIGADALAVGAPAVAFAAWQAYLYAVTGDPLQALTAQEAYLRRPSAPWEAVAALFDGRTYSEPWSVLVLLVAMTALVAAAWRVLSPALAAYATATLLLAVSTGTLLSFPRYALAILPAFLVLGAAGRLPAVHYTYLLLATLLAVLFTAKYATWWWVA